MTPEVKSTDDGVVPETTTSEDFVSDDVSFSSESLAPTVTPDVKLPVDVEPVMPEVVVSDAHVSDVEVPVNVNVDSEVVVEEPVVPEKPVPKHMVTLSFGDERLTLEIMRVENLLADLTNYCIANWANRLDILVHLQYPEVDAEGCPFLMHRLIESEIKSAQIA